MSSRRILITAVLYSLALAGTTLAQDESGKKASWFDDLDYDLHGFYEVRSGYRMQNDRYEKDMSVMESRMQVDISGYTDEFDYKFKADIYGDLVDERGYFDMREANIAGRLNDDMDYKIGRQILTWGTGDLIFINDLFPKDWQSFFVGRDTEYLKAPSDAGKLSWFNDAVNVDFVYTPQFDSDRHITGEKISYWNSSLLRTAGNDAVVHTDKPDRWFRDDEFALRMYKNIDNVEYALYGYWGYWKSPGGSNGGQALFPDLNVYGGSIRSAVGKGIGNVEMGYYESADDKSGKNPMINNSELRFLVGYSQEVAKNLNVGLQYYIEHMVDYSAYEASHPGGPKRDRNRHLTTLRITKLMMNQNLRLSIFTYYSPSDKDVYIRPNLNYKVNDKLALEIGGNIFFGDYPETFFGQFDNNTNIYTAVRYNF